MKICLLYRTKITNTVCSEVKKKIIQYWDNFSLWNFEEIVFEDKQSFTAVRDTSWRSAGSNKATVFVNRQPNQNDGVRISSEVNFAEQPEKRGLLKYHDGSKILRFN